MVPEYTPDAAYVFMKQWINGDKFLKEEEGEKIFGWKLKFFSGG
jgi:hypothetical protein